MARWCRKKRKCRGQGVRGQMTIWIIRSSRHEANRDGIGASTLFCSQIARVYFLQASKIPQMSKPNGMIERHSGGAHAACVAHSEPLRP